MSDDKKYSALPENADKILFAEDLANYMYLNIISLPPVSSGIADFRSVIENPFNPQFGLAAQYVHGFLVDEVMDEYSELLLKRMDDTDAFLKYVDDWKPTESVLAFDHEAANFFQFCVRIAIMAEQFYQCGFTYMPRLAVEQMTKVLCDIDMVGEGGWETLNSLVARYAQLYTDQQRTGYLSPKFSSDEEPDSPSSNDSEASLSPDHEVNGGNSEDEHPEESSDGERCSTSSSPDKEVSSSSISKQSEETSDIKAGKAVNLLDINSAHESSGSSEQENFDASTHSFQDTSDDDNSSRQKRQKTQNEKPSCSYSVESDSYSKRSETDINTNDCIDPFSRQLTEKHLVPFKSSVDELHKSHLSQDVEASSSDLTTEDKNKSLIQEEDLVQSCTKLSPMQNPVPKKK